MVTEAQVNAILQGAVDYLEDVRVFGAATGVTDFNTCNDALQGVNRAEMAAALKGLRSRFGSSFSPQAASGLLAMVLAEYGPVLAIASRSDGLGVAVSELTRYYITNSKRVMSRGLSFGTPSAGGSNVGTGTLRRLSVDQWGQVIENGTAEAKRVRCVGSSSTTAEKQKSVWQVLGAPLGPDPLEEGGSGIAASLTALSAADSISFARLQNPSFDLATPTPASSGVTALTALTNWTCDQNISAGTKFGIDTTIYYRSYEGVSQPGSLKLTTGGLTAFVLSQNLETAGINLDTGAPVYAHVAIYNDSAGAAGTVTLRLGNASVSVALNTLASNMWTLLKLAFDSTCYPKYFAKAGLTLSVELTGGNANAFHIDDVCVGNWTFIDGGYYAMVGAATDFELEDVFTFTDAEYAGSKIQAWLRRALGAYLPSSITAPTSAPSSALAGAGAGNVDNGAHSYFKAWVDVNGVEGGLSSSSVTTVTDKTTDGKVTVGRVDASPGSHIAYWRIFRSKAGTTTPKYLLADVAIGTSSYTDNIADASLPATQPTGVAVTLADP